MNSAKFAAIAFLALSLLALTNIASAKTSVDFSNSGGTLSGTSAGLTLTGSTLVAIEGLGGGVMKTGDLGRVGFQTGHLISGSLAMGGTFAAGGMFSIETFAEGGTVLFSGTFSGPVTWTLVTLANGTHNYTLTGDLTGVMHGGINASAVTVQLTINTGKGFFEGSTLISGGDTTAVSASVPEPGSLAMLATGSLSLFGVMRRKLFQR
ncbi:MAG TPA: PEP-CTERM sorting domain-containing protein [Dongiaceae bacterium]|nr:PEP-CTERM sorting domain-containing protein [Dongiaceae bacterium]